MAAREFVNGYHPAAGERLGLTATLNKQRQLRKSNVAVSPARIAAFNILLRVERESAYAVELLHSQILDDLSPVDRNLVTEIVMGVLRWRSVLDETIALPKFYAFPQAGLRSPDGPPHGRVPETISQQGSRTRRRE